MLRYDVRLNGNSFKRNELVWGEKYLSPDLSYIAGTTSPSNHLEMFTHLAASNSINNMDNTLSVEATNVIREGYVVVSGKTYEVKSDTYIDYSMLGTDTSAITYNYVFINGKYFYEHEISEGFSGYTIDNLPHAVEVYSDLTDDLVESVLDYITIDGSTIRDNKFKVDSVYWIEDETVEIDGEKYVFNKDENGGKKISGGVLKTTDDGNPLDASAITECDEIICKPYSSTTLYEEVTKFVLTKELSTVKDFSNISFCRRYYYVKYKEHYCPVKRLHNGDTFEFVCEVPNYVLKGTNLTDDL